MVSTSFGCSSLSTLISGPVPLQHCSIPSLRRRCLCLCSTSHPRERRRTTAARRRHTGRQGAYHHHRTAHSFREQRRHRPQPARRQRASQQRTPATGCRRGGPLSPRGTTAECTQLFASATARTHLSIILLSIIRPFWNNYYSG